MLKPIEKTRAARDHWVNNNLKFLSETVTTFLGRPKAVLEEVDKGKAVALIKGDELAGAVIPAHFIYAYYLNGRTTQSPHVLTHVNEADFFDDPEQYVAEMRNLYNVVLLRRGQPHSMLATRGFINGFRTTETGHLEPKDERYYDRLYGSAALPVNKVPQMPSPQSTRGMELLKPMFEASRREMSAADQKIMREVVRIFREIAPKTPEDYQAAVSELRINTKLQAAHKTAHEVGQPLNAPFL